MKHKKRLVVLYIILILILAFIWGNSFIPREESAHESSVIGAIITPVLEVFVGKGNVTDFLVRKLAHFTEYAALGVVAGLILFAKDRVRLHGFLFSLFAGVTAAVIDESIQLFTDGRGAQVSDVLLDSCGAACGLILTCLIGTAICKIKKKSR